jgi:carbonic anhydrase
LKKKGIALKVSEAHSGVRDLLRKEGIEDVLGHLSRRDTLHDIVVGAMDESEPDIKRPQFKPKTLEPPEIVSQIIMGNNFYMQTHPREYFELFSYDQKPYITLVSCADSRVPLTALMPDTSNKVFSIQNIGNQILSTEGSVDYGVYHLQTPILFFLGHSDCAAIKAYMKGFDDVTDSIKHELDFLRPIISEACDENSGGRIHGHIIEKNLDYQVNIAYKKYRSLIQAKKLTVIAGFYDFHDEFGNGTGNVVIVNVNKEKKVEELHRHPIFSYLSDKQKKLHVGRMH